MFRHPSYSKLFKLYGDRIMSNRMIYFSREHPVMVFIQRIVFYALEHQSVDRSRFEDLRIQYTRQMYRCLMANEEQYLKDHLTEVWKVTDDLLLGPLDDKLPAIAAVLEDAWMLLSHTKGPSDLIRPIAGLFPNALDAAVASGKIEILSVILEYLKHNVKGRTEANSWNDMRAAARAMVQGLRIAVRLHENNAAMMILKFLADNRIFRESADRKLPIRLVHDCIKHGNVDLLHGALIYKQAGRYDATDKEQPELSPMLKDEILSVFELARPGALRCLIKRGFLNPNEGSQSTRGTNSKTQIKDGRKGSPDDAQVLPESTPLQMALRYQAYERARILLDNGAQPDALLRGGTGHTALWYAASRGHFKAVKMLLEYGANPFHWSADKSPFCIAQRGRLEGHAKCEFLLKKVYAHGKEVLQRPDLWEGYEKPAGI
jgi:hypothetical protein